MLPGCRLPGCGHARLQPAGLRRRGLSGCQRRQPHEEGLQQERLVGVAGEGLRRLGDQPDGRHRAPQVRIAHADGAR